MISDSFEVSASSKVAGVSVDSSRQLSQSQSANFMREASKLKKQVKFVPTPSPPSGAAAAAATSEENSVMTSEAGTSTICNSDVGHASAFPQLPMSVSGSNNNASNVI